MVKAGPSCTPFLCDWVTHTTLASVTSTFLARGVLTVPRSAMLELPLITSQGHCPSHSCPKQLRGTHTVSLTSPSELWATCPLSVTLWGLGSLLSCPGSSPGVRRH